MKGFFITLDGIDGAGKSTHLAFIRTWLKEQNIDAVFTREPGGTPIGENLRQILLSPESQICADTETLLMFAARAQHLHDVIVPALKAGRWVVSDRFTEATFAYQHGGRGLPYNKIEQLEQWVQADLRPDLNIILDVPWEVAKPRLESHLAPDRFEQENGQFFNAVRETYRMRAQRNPQCYALVRSDREKSVVQAEIQQVLSHLLLRKNQ